MGLQILSVTIGALVLISTINYFSNWYARFLKNRPIGASLQIQLGRILWAVFAVTFWLAMFRYGMPEKFDTSHFLFVSFIYSVHRLIGSFFSSPAKPPT